MLNDTYISLVTANDDSTLEFRCFPDAPDEKAVNAVSHLTEDRLAEDRVFVSLLPSFDTSDDLSSELLLPLALTE